MNLLTPDILISAYAQGIFPMGVEGQVQWFSPDPRAILPLDGFRCSKTLRQTVRSGKFEIRIDSSFREVMLACGERGEGTWITPELVKAYSQLARLGLAHSVETWRGGQQLPEGILGWRPGMSSHCCFHRPGCP